MCLNVFVLFYDVVFRLDLFVVLCVLLVSCALVVLVFVCVCLFVYVYVCVCLLVCLLSACFAVLLSFALLTGIPKGHCGIPQSPNTMRTALMLLIVCLVDCLSLFSFVPLLARLLASLC